MGWFVGAFGSNEEHKENIKLLSADSLFTAEQDHFFIAAGGLKSTTFWEWETDRQSGWVSSGIAISKLEDDEEILSARDWKFCLQQGQKTVRELNGHFAAIRWDQNEAELFTDQLGIRNIFIHKGDEFTVFSTRLDWLKKLIPETDINWRKFGSRWMSINQFSNDSFMCGIDRLSQGGYCILSQNKMQLSNTRWNYEQGQTSPEEFKNALFHFTKLPLKQGRKLSLGLSGGLDSRMLLAVLQKTPRENWGLHTFGEEGHPDLEAAKQLNNLIGRTHHIYTERIPSAATLENLLPDYIGQTLFTSSPSHLIGFQAYGKIAEPNTAVIDGGFGEIARRRFLVSVLMRAKKALHQKNIPDLLPYFRMQRADIFNAECNREMREGFEEELAEEIHAMPDISEIGIENWLDLFSIRTRVPNGAGPEQARSDAELFNYMPFLQPLLISRSLNMPLRYRKNARLFREIIKDNEPRLQKVPLVKGEVSYPYWMKDITAAIWMRLKKKAGVYHKSNLQADFLLRVEEYVRDLYGSQSAREFPAYDHHKIEKLISGFYDDKNRDLAAELNWWLAFEVFRRL